MKKRNEKLALNRETVRRLTEIAAGGGTGDQIITPETASEPIEACTTTNAMVSACIC